jgi:ECF sigma factor
MERRGSVTGMLLGLRSDDPAVRDAAARQIWDRYFRDLLALARKNLDKRIRLRTDEEDVAQSMFKSFCLRQQRGEFDLAGRDELWKLLVTITLRKARNAAKAQ